MLKSIWNIFRKECYRFLSDPRMILVTIVLPALIMFGVYAIMGIGLSDMLQVQDGYAYRCYVENESDIYAPIFEGLQLETIAAESVEAAKEQVRQKNADLLVIFPENFDTQLFAPAADGSVPNIQVFYNADSVPSQIAYENFLKATEQLEISIVNVLDVNRDVESANLATQSNMLLSVLPTLILMALLSSCTSIAGESIADEKERGTFATLLVTPISRTAIAVGKIASLGLFATVAGLTSFLSMLLGMQYMLPEEAMDLFPTYGFQDYALLLLVILSTVLMTVSIIAVFSALAKTVKEAAASATIVTFLGMLVSSVNMFSSSFAQLAWKCAPILGSTLCINDILIGNCTVSGIVLSCGCNLVITVVMLFTLAKLFSSEKVMFSK